MVQINFALKEVNCKVVYYGPGMSGKTTNLEVVHKKAPKTNCGDLTSIATEGDRTLFFDFLPLNLGKVAGMNTKFQIYTVPGQVYYNSTRKLVLQGADGIVFVADSRGGKMDENLESLKNLVENLNEYGMDINTIPLVIQYNKRDMDGALPVEDLEEAMNPFGAPYVEAVAVSGEGVFATLKKLSTMVLENLNQQHGSARARPQQRVPKKEPAMASATAASAGAAPTAQPVPVKRGQRGGAGDAPAAQDSRTVKERVSRSSGVKSIERKVPTPGARVKRKRPEFPAAAMPKKKGGSKVAIFIVVVTLLAAAGAAVYFTGIWKNFL